MTTNDPLIFSPRHLSILGLEHDPQRQNEATPYPFAHDPHTNTSCFFNPLGDMVSFRMLERALARCNVEVTLRNNSGDVTVNMSIKGQSAQTFSLVESIDMIECYVAAALITLEKLAPQSPLASP